MQITVLYFAHLRKAAGNIREEELTVPEGASLKDAVEEAVRRHPNLQPHLPSILVTRNRQWSERAATLAEGDEIGIMPPVSGG